MAALPRNNLSEQLAIFRANNSVKPSETQQSGGRKAFSFHKFRSDPGGKNSATPFKPPGSSLQFRSNTAAKLHQPAPPSNTADAGSRRWLHNDSTHSNISGTTGTAQVHTHKGGGGGGGWEGRGGGGDELFADKENSAVNSIFQTNSANKAEHVANRFQYAEGVTKAPAADSGAEPIRQMGDVGRPRSYAVARGNSISPPIAMVAPVVSSSGQATVAESEARKLKSVQDSSHTSTTTLPHPVPSPTLPPNTQSKASMAGELRDVHSQRVAVMDAVCELLSDIPAAKINTMFGVSADHIQRKLAIRKQLLSREDDIKRKLSPHTTAYVHRPSSSPSPLSHPPQHTDSLSTNYSPQSSILTSTKSPLPTPDPDLTTQRMIESHTSDRTWEMNDEDIIDSLSDDNEFLPFTSGDKHFDPAMECEERERKGSAIADTNLGLSSHAVSRSGTCVATGVPSTDKTLSTISPTFPSHSSEVIEIQPSPPQGGTISKPTKPAPFKPPFSSSSHPSCNSFRPSLGAMPDNADEFQGSYPHTQEMMKIFTQVFGLQRFRPKQLEAVNASLLGADCFILMPTGGGKSLCYQLPALMSAGVTVVVSPLRSLIQDQVQKLCSLEIPARYLSSDLSPGEESAVYSSLVLRDPTTKLLYVTPEKLSASNKLLSTLRNLYSRSKLSRFVIDEAHCISQWGHDFRPDYKRLSELRQNFPKVPIMALTATATPRVRADILHQLSMKQTKWFTQSFNRTNLQYSILPKKPKKIAEDIITLIKSTFKDQSGIIYCLSRRDCEVMSGELHKAGVAALCYHAGLSDGERSAVQQRWVQEDHCKVVCATIAFGMGIDKPDVRFVIHHSLPKSVEGYYQEAGRAGRDGLPANCFLFYNYSDMGRLRRMIKAEHMSWEQERTHLENLYRMVQYCENEADCRRVQVLAYFAEQFDASECRDGTTPCDNCRSHIPFHTEDVTGLVKVIVQSIQSVKRDQFTLVQILEALKGSTAVRIKSSELGSLPLYNRGGKLGKHDLERLLHTLVMTDILSESLHIGSHDNVVCYVKPGSKARDVLSGRAGKVTLRIRGKVHVPSTSKDSKQTQSKEDRIKEDCYKALLSVRIRVAQQFKMNNPESVFSTETLREMSRQLPTTQEQMLKVVGVTSVKLKNLNGRDFLEVTQNFASQLPIADTCSPYWTKSGKENRNVPARGSKGKRKSSSAGAPKAKKPAVVTRSSTANSGDEFEPEAVTSKSRRPGFLPPPRPNITT